MDSRGLEREEDKCCAACAKGEATRGERGHWRREGGVTGGWGRLSVPSSNLVGNGHLR